MDPERPADLGTDAPGRGHDLVDGQRGRARLSRIVPGFGWFQESGSSWIRDRRFGQMFVVKVETMVTTAGVDGTDTHERVS